MKISIHPLFFLFGLYFAFTGKVFLFLNFTLTALIHEIGHSFALEQLGYKMNKISLMPYGAVVNSAIEGLSYKDEIKVAFFGPLFNLFVCLVFLALWWLMPELYPYLDSVVFSNLCVFAINLLPAYPLDGGRIVCATLSLRFKRKTALKVTVAISIIISLLLLALFIYSVCIRKTNLSLLFFSLFLVAGWAKRSKESAYVRTFFSRSISAIKIKECKHFIVKSDLLLKEIIALTQVNCFFTMEVISPNGELLGYYDYSECEKILSSYRLYDKLEDIIKDIFPYSYKTTA